MGTVFSYFQDPVERERVFFLPDDFRIARKVGDTPLLARTMNNYLLAAFRPGRNAERRRFHPAHGVRPGVEVTMVRDRREYDWSSSHSIVL